MTTPLELIKKSLATAGNELKVAKVGTQLVRDKQSTKEIEEAIEKVESIEKRLGSL